MASSSVAQSTGMRELRYRNRNCWCNRRAAIGISDSDQNPGKLYSKCAKNVCKYFDWVHPENVEGPVENVVQSTQYDMDTLNRLTRVELQCVEIEELKQKFAQFEGSNNGMKIVLGFCVMLLVCLMLKK